MLKNGWEKAVDEATGSTYYINRKTGQTSWSPPSNEPLPRGWQELRDDQGRTYYHNKETQQTTWHDPRAAVSSSNSSTSSTASSSSTSTTANGNQLLFTPTPPSGRRPREDDADNDSLAGRTRSKSETSNRSYNTPDQVSIEVPASEKKLGITLVHERDKDATVENVSFGEFGHRSGIQIGDVLYAVVDKKKERHETKYTLPWKLEEIMRTRPLKLIFKRYEGRSYPARPPPATTTTSTTSSSSPNGTHEAEGGASLTPEQIAKQERLKREVESLRREHEREEAELEHLRRQVEALRAREEEEASRTPSSSTRARAVETTPPPSGSSSASSGSGGKPGGSILKTNRRYMSESEMKLQAARKRALPPEWEEYTSDEGYVYFINKVSGERTYTDPRMTSSE